MMEQDESQKILEDQQKTLEIYSSMLEQANRNFEEKVKELSIIRRLGDALLFARDLKKICRVILEIVVDEFNTEFGSLMLLNQEGNLLKLFAATSQMEQAIKYFDDSSQVAIPLGEGIAGRVALEKSPILIQDTEKDARFVPRASGHLVRSLLCLPLVDRDKLLGVINLSSPVKMAFNEEDERVMNIMSDQAALALQNAMLLRKQVRNERMSAIGKMAATIVHDIKNPMTKLKGFAEIMAEPDTSQDDRNECARIIVEEIARFVNMTEELMEFASGGESRLNLLPIMLGDFIRGIVPFLERDFSDADVKLTTDIEYDALIMIDIQKFQRVIFNLTGNAKDAMPDGGKVIISTAKDEENAVISVSDTGKGMSEDLMEKIFIPFVTSGKAKGTGLGLAIVKKIVEDHRGSIEAKSEEGKGAEFIITMPVSEE